jgi:molybdate transport system substrate-binding protein
MPVRFAAILAFAGLCALQSADAAEVKVLTAGAFKPIVLAVAADFEKQSGHKLVIDNDTAGGAAAPHHRGRGVRSRRADACGGQGTRRGWPDRCGYAEEPGADLGRRGGQGRRPASRHRDSRGLQGHAAGRGKVAYIDPAAGGSSGIYFAKLLETMGLAEAVKAKAVLVPGGLVAQRS